MTHEVKTKIRACGALNKTMSSRYSTVSVLKVWHFYMQSPPQARFFFGIFTSEYAISKAFLAPQAKISGIWGGFSAWNCMDVHKICGLSTIFCGLLSTKFVDCPQFFLKSDGDPQFTNCPQFSSKCILWIVHNFRITRPLEDRFFSRLRRAKLEYFPLTTALKA